MGKGDPKQPKIRFEQKRQARQNDQVCDNTELNAPDTEQDIDIKALMLEVRSSLRSIDTKLDNMTSQLESVKTLVGTHETRLDCLENRHTECCEFQQEFKQHITNLEKEVELLRAKADDLEARSRR